MPSEVGSTQADPKQIELFPWYKLFNDVSPATGCSKQALPQTQEFRSGGPSIHFLSHRRIAELLRQRKMDLVRNRACPQDHSILELPAREKNATHRPWRTHLVGIDDKTASSGSFKALPSSFGALQVVEESDTLLAGRPYPRVVQPMITEVPARV